MRCCFGRTSNVVRCHVVIISRLSLEGAEEATRPAVRMSVASLHTLPRAERGTDEGNPDDFVPPTHFPGLATLVSTHLKAGARARSVEVTRLSCAPAAGAPMLCSITLACDLTFAEKSAHADDWREALRAPPALLRTETDILQALAEPPPGLASVNEVKVCEAGVKREDSAHRVMGRPSQRRLRSSLSTDAIDAQMLAAPPGTFNIAAPPPAE